MRMKIELIAAEQQDWHAGAADVDLAVLSDVFAAVWNSRELAVYKEVTVTLSLVTEETIRDYNKRYREIDESTDVLSFPLWEDDGKFSPPCEWDELPLGDVIISPKYICRSAQDLNIDYNRETVLVVIHGILHLVGFDHDTDDRERVMWHEQEFILNEYFERIRACNNTNPGED